MRKNLGVGLFLVSVIVLGLVMAGCDAIGPSDTTTTVRATTTTTAHATTTTAHATTTSTAGGTTTTTAGGTTTTTSTSTTTSTTTTTVLSNISGTISQGVGGSAVPWGFGLLWTGVSTDEFDTFLDSYGTSKVINTGEASSTYEVVDLPPGTYYLVAALYLGTTELPSGAPPAGAPIGEFSDGLFVRFGSGTAEPLVITNSDLTNKDWTIESVMPSLEGTISGMMTNLNTLTMTNDVNVVRVFASTNAGNLQGSIASFTLEAVASAETTKSYTINIGHQGNYYIWATLQPGTAISVTPPRYGDYRGEYLDGLVPSTMAMNWNLVAAPGTSAKTGTPEGVACDGENVTDIDFDLKAVKVP